MALNTPADSLTELIDPIRLDDRLENWLWLRVVGTSSSAPVESFQGKTMRTAIAEEMSKNKYDRDWVEKEMSAWLLSDNSFEWIKTDNRQIEWLLGQFSTHSRYFLPVVPPRLFGRALLIAMIDMWPAPLAAKQGTVTTLHVTWNEHIKGDTLVSWFEKENKKEKIALAWEFFSRLTPGAYGVAPFIDKNDLLKYFDKRPWSHIEKQHYIDRIKTQWRQRVYRERHKHKKQCNFVLPIQAVDQLDQLAKQRRMSRAEIIESLILSEFEKCSAPSQER